MVTLTLHITITHLTIFIKNFSVQSTALEEYLKMNLNYHFQEDSTFPYSSHREQLKDLDIILKQTQESSKRREG